jgi:Fe-S-cluster containining protein
MDFDVKVNGFHFLCDKCGNCCRNFKGVIYLSIHELNTIADNLNLTLEEVFNKFVHIERENAVLNGDKINLCYLAINQINDKCVFLDRNNHCLIDDYKPFLCKLFPFWSIIIEDKEKFGNYMELCKGFGNKDGMYYGKEEIEKMLATEEKYLQQLNRVALIMDEIDETEILRILLEEMDLEAKIDDEALDYLKNNLMIEKIRVLINQNS